MKMREMVRKEKSARKRMSWKWSMYREGHMQIEQYGRGRQLVSKVDFKSVKSKIVL